MRETKKRVWLLGVLAVLAPFLSPISATAIDFKIDVPEFREEHLKDELAADGVALRRPEGDVLWETETLPLPEQPPFPLGKIPAEPTLLSRSKTNRSSQDPFAVKPSIYQTSAFPIPQCLTPNVAFWKRIYREVKTSEALIHDRSFPGRVFGKLSLPVPRRERARAMTLAREHFEKKLKVLARKLKRKQKLKSEERRLLSVFEVGKRNSREVARAAQRLRIQSGLEQRFEAGVGRSLRYMPTISRILRQYNVPYDIIHLPHVESSYIRTARSKVGAVGLWQIMPATMRRLMGKSAVRKRTHLTISTRAAAKLLNQNYRLLKSWPLALTAYNHGATGVRRGVRATGSRDICKIIANYKSPSFRFASSNFYAQFLAARHVALDKYRALSKSNAHRKVLQPLLAHARKERL